MFLDEFVLCYSSMNICVEMTVNHRSLSLYLKDCARNI